jgi:hypothetical protein
MWLEHFSQFRNLTFADLRDAVREYYNQPNQPVPQPANISSLARKYSRERYERSDLDSEERRRHEALCDAKSAPELLSIEAAAENRRLAIESYARTFGITEAEAVTRMQPGMDARNELDAVRVATAHLRQSRPPAPVPCPDCGSTKMPCPCEEDPAIVLDGEPDHVS